MEGEKFEFLHCVFVGNWITKVNRMNKDFFSIYRERLFGSSLRVARDFSRVLHTYPDKVLRIALGFYRHGRCTLYRDVLAREKIWSHTRMGVTNNKCLVLMVPSLLKICKMQFVVWIFLLA